MIQAASSRGSLMYCRKSIAPRIEPSGTPAFTEHSCKDFDYYNVITEKWRNKAKHSTWYSTVLEFVKKTSLAHLVKILGYNKCYSSSTPWSVKCPKNSIRYHYKRICYWARRPKTRKEIRKLAKIVEMSKKDFTNKLTPPNILEQKKHRWHFQTI